MKISQLLHAMDREDNIIINDEEENIDKNRLYCGNVRGIYRDSPINKYHITKIFAYGDVIVVFAVEPKWKGAKQ